MTSESMCAYLDKIRHVGKHITPVFDEITLAKKFKIESYIKC